MPDSIIQQINEGGVDKLAPPSALQAQVKKNPEVLRDFLSQLFGIKDAVRAYKGEMTEEEAQNFALTAALGVIPMAGELGPAARVAEEVAPEAAQSITQMIRAYHGSPYDFDKFDLSKIGTGEGAQAYGHGLYFAENPAVAGEYKQRLSSVSGTKAIADNLVNRFGGDRTAALAEYNRIQPMLGHDSDVSDAIIKHINQQPFGRMYEVNINADPEHFLDWDKPLSEQSPQVQQSLFNIPGVREAWSNDSSFAKYRPGERFDPLEGRTPVEVSEQLRQAGIPGIRYLDQGSRGSGTGTHNYVVFDDKLVDIIKKYGLAGLVAGGASNFMPKQK